MPYKKLALKITDHFYKNQSLENLRNGINVSKYCKLFPEDSYLCSFNGSHMANDCTNFTEPFYSSTFGGYKIRNGIATLFVMLIICISLYSNSVLCRTVFFTKVRSATNIFIGNLSVSNILMTVVNVPMQFVSTALSNWPFGSVLCKSLRFVQELSVATSAFTIACIALDRYYLITYPLKAKPTLNTTLRKLTFIWILAATISLPYILMAKIQNSNDSCREIIRCTIIYPEPSFKNQKLFTLLSFFFVYIIPLSLSAITYIRICMIIKKRNIVGTATHDQIIHHKAAKQKTIKLLIAVLATFALGWLPIIIYHICSDFSERNVDIYKSNIYLICYIIAMSSVCYNPFIYFWMNKKFRKRVRSHIKSIEKIKKCGQFLCTLKRLYNYEKVQRLSDTTLNDAAYNCSKATPDAGGVSINEMQQTSEKTESKSKGNNHSIPFLKMKSIFFTSLPNVHDIHKKNSLREKHANLFKSMIVSTTSCETSL